MDDGLIVIASAALTAAINPFGAELTHLRDAGGAEWMTDADPAYWSGHAPLLFPIVGALNGGTYLLDGVRYPLPQHGFARRNPFAVVDQGADFVRLCLTDTAETRAVWPFAFALDAAYRVAGTTLTSTITVTNTGERAMPASFGFHPAFAWPLPGCGAKDAHRIVFEHDEPGFLARLDAGLVAGTDRPSPLDGRALALCDALFAADALIWDGLASRSVVCGVAGGPALRIDFPDADKLGIWSKPGARFVCIEPWWGIADPAGFTGEVWDKPGMLRIAPGEARGFGMAVTVLP